MRHAALALALATVLTSGCGNGNTAADPASSSPAPTGSAHDALLEDGRFAIMIELLGGFTEIMSDPSWNGTLFAPTDATFDALPPGTLARLRDDASLAERTQVIRTHLLPFRLPSDRFEARRLTTVHGERTLQMEVSEDIATIDGARIVEPDLAGSDGRIHVIDAVLGLEA